MLVCVDACMRGCFVAWMLECLDVWMLGCLDAWMLVCLDAWMLGCLDRQSDSSCVGIACSCVRVCVWGRLMAKV